MPGCSTHYKHKGSVFLTTEMVQLWQAQCSLLSFPGEIPTGSTGAGSTMLFVSMPIFPWLLSSAGEFN